MVKGTAFAALAMMLVGSSIGVLGTLRDFPVYLGQAMRFALAAVLLGVVLHLRGRRVGEPRPAVAPGQWLRIVVLAAIGMLGFNVAATAAERHSDPALVGVVVGCAPVAVALVIPLIRRSRPSLRILVAALIVAVGAAIAQNAGGHTDLLGFLLALAALAGEVTFALVAAPLLDQLGPLRVSTYACVVAVPLAVAGMVATGGYAVPSTAQLVAVAWLGVVVTAVAYVLWFAGIHLIGPERAALFTGLIPVSAVVVTGLIGSGTPTWIDLACAAIVLLGLVVGCTDSERTEPVAAPRPSTVPTAPQPRT